MTGITRRRFLLGSANALALGLVQLKANWALAAGESGTAQVPGVAYADFEAVYKNKWTWDKITHSSHSVNCWYQRSCAWNIYVKDGVVWREEQTATYEQIDPRIPDFNPRGCQKGCSYSERMYDDSRVRYPLKRVGKRGGGQWKRVSWDEALDDIADKMIDAMTSKEGPASMIMDMGTGPWGLQMLTKIRHAALLDMPYLDVNAEIGDHRPGLSVTAGKQEMCSSADDLFHSDLILIWGGNPLYTQIPNAHFMTEARYNGSRIVCIAPDFSASAVHADLWVPVKVGSDAALGLSMAHVMVEEGLYKKRFIQEQSDLPLLTFVDNGRFLRQSDIKAGGSAEVFYLHDLASKQVVEASTRTLELGPLDPALEGVFEVDTLKGKAKVRPVFAGLRKHLQQYKPEKASPICGVAPDLIRGLAREIAGARACSFVAQSNFSKFYHGLEMERAQILCAVLAGQIGHKGAGYMGFPSLAADGFDPYAALPGNKNGVKAAIGDLQAAMGPAVAGLMESGLTQEAALYELSRHEHPRGSTVGTVNWLYGQAGLKDFYGRSAEWDPAMKRPLSSFMDEAVAKGWQFNQNVPTRVFIVDSGNPFRRLRGFDQVQEQLLKQLELLVTVDFRMSNTALFSDYVLPAAGWYEYNDINWSTPLSPYMHSLDAAVKPLGEARSSDDTHYLIAKAIQRRAAARGIKEFKDRAGKPRTFDIYDKMTFGGEITEHTTEASINVLLSLTTNAGGVDWDKLRKKGWQRYTSIGNAYLDIGNATDVAPDKTISTGTHHTEKKMPWPTLTRRLQFSIDHPFYEELGEVLPTHKEPPKIGGKYPLKLTGGHTRWSIHSAWIDQKYQAQLRRGQPVVFINAADAKARGIKDGDMVRVFNDLSSVEFMACVAAATRPGQAIVYHAWEAFQFKGKPYDSLFPSPINPIQLAGGYGHIQPRPAVFTPGQHDRGTAVDIKRIA